VREFFNRGSHGGEIEIGNEKEKMDMIMDLRRLSEIFGVIAVPISAISLSISNIQATETLQHIKRH
jgi:hypothetical protein